MSKGWPLNDETYPPVVGPGDQVRVYMNQKITSIKSYWKGDAQVTLTDTVRPEQPMERLRTRFPHALVLAFAPAGEPAAGLDGRHGRQEGCARPGRGAAAGHGGTDRIR